MLNREECLFCKKKRFLPVTLDTERFFKCAHCGHLYFEKTDYYRRKGEYQELYFRDSPVIYEIETLQMTVPCTLKITSSESYLLYKGQKFPVTENTPFKMPSSSVTLQCMTK